MAPRTQQAAPAHRGAGDKQDRRAAPERQAGGNSEMGGAHGNSLLNSGIDSVQVVVDRGDVEAGNPGPTLNTLRHLLLDAATVRRFRSRLDLLFSGYDADPRELYEVQEVRAFMLSVDREFPFWLYFMNLRQDMLMVIYLCLCQYTVNPDGSPVLDRKCWGKLLERHFIAMNWLAEKHGLGEGVIDQRSKDITQFFGQWSSQ